MNVYAKKMEEGEPDRTCRICFETDDAEDAPKDEKRGRLFSPCLWRGSARFVHERCLETWRHTDGMGKAYYQCTTCKYEYRMARAMVYSYLVHPVVVGSLTVIAIFLMGLLLLYAIRLGSWVFFGVAMSTKKAFFLTQRIVMWIMVIIGVIVFLVAMTRDRGDGIRPPNIVFLDGSSGEVLEYVFGGIGTCAFISQIYDSIYSTMRLFVVTAGTPVLDISYSTKIE